ncbi:hypothetical protein [Paenibacillus flagellatus]|uniref:Uncharacterized protein n=1 Tax=Paenibacillus flagellatus TaxID=2211139 RepID=A0A2V5JWI0_9BACL|nr:hypothetical protein [Paenibacillus flagellatus]PYI51165.1 hypothetical protein DLM86_26105 [Paenibacillus flagellatus]
MGQKRKWLVTGIVGVAIATGIYVGQAAIISNADGATQPGSADDPLVTKSYLDEQLKKLTGGQWTGSGTGTGQTGSGGSTVSEARIQEMIAAEIAKLKQELQRQPQQPTTPTTGTAPTLEVLKLGPGQILYAGAGAEVIVRTGKTIAVSNDDGIPDLTSGVDLPAGSAITNNHLLVFPREGRGIKPDPKNKDEIYVMVRGSYILLKEDGTKSAP